MDKLVYDTLDAIPVFADKVFFVAQLTDDAKDIVLPSLAIRRVGSESEVFLDEPPQVSSVTYTCIIYEKDPVMLDTHEEAVRGALVSAFTLDEYRHVEDVLSEEDGDIYVRFLTFTIGD